MWKCGKEEAVNYALEVVGKENFALKRQQLEILQLITIEKKDVLAVLPTGFGKSLIYHRTILRVHVLRPWTNCW